MPDVAISKNCLSYFLSGEKVCKEPPGTFRMVPGLPRRPNGERTNQYIDKRILPFPLWKPHGRDPTSYNIVRADNIRP